MTRNKLIVNLLGSVLFLFISSSCISQEGSTYIEQWEVYGIELVFKEKLISSKLKCGKGWLKEKQLTLYKIELRETLFQRDSTVFSEEELQQVRYIVLPSDQQIELNKVICLTAGNSSVKDYLTGFRLFSTDEISQMENVNTHSYLQGMEQCYKLSFWDRIRLFFGADESKIYRELRNEERSNSFYKYIIDANKE